MASGTLPPLHLPAADSHGLPPADSRRCIVDVAAMWTCPCRGGCTTLAATQCLYNATIDVLDHHDSGDFNAVMPPLTVVVSRQKTLAGQEACRRYAEAMAAADHVAALAACHSLIAIEQDRVAI